jgi:hypothetical protein
MYVYENSSALGDQEVAHNLWSETGSCVSDKKPQNGKTGYESYATKRNGASVFP